MRNRRLLWISACGVALFGWANVTLAAPLAPDDPSIAGNLSVWLRDATANFDTGTGTWSDVSGNGHDAVVAGLTPVGVTYGAPTFAAQRADTGAFAGKAVAGVLFQGDVDDLLKADNINTGTAMSDMTIITVYRSPVADNIQRAAGIGSLTNTVDLGTRDVVFNQAADASLRYDWGKTLGTLTQPDDVLFVRGSTLTGSVVNDYFDGVVNIDAETAAPGGAGLPPAEDAFYIGDVRGGATPIFNSGSVDDIFVAEVIVYNTALSQQQVSDIGEWLQANIAEVPEPASCILLGAGLLSLFGCRLIRRTS